MTFSYFPYWKKIAHEIEGASQRLQQDPERFARIVERLGLGLFRAILTLIAFIPILWNLSAELTESVNKKSIKFNETFIDLSKADESLLDSSLRGLDFVIGVEGSLMWWLWLFLYWALAYLLLSALNYRAWNTTTSA